MKFSVKDFFSKCGQVLAEIDFISFEQLIWFDQKVQYGYSDVTEDTKVQDHLKFYG